jgi:hypothetical protein
LPRHGADVGHLAIGENEIAGLHAGAKLPGGALQIVFGLGAIGELLNFLGEKRVRLIVLEFFFDFGANFFEGWR